MYKYRNRHTWCMTCTNTGICCYLLDLLSRKKKNTRSRHPHAVPSSEIQTISEPRPEIRTALRNRNSETPGSAPLPHQKKTRKKKTPLKEKDSQIYLVFACRRAKAAGSVHARAHTAAAAATTITTHTHKRSACLPVCPSVCLSICLSVYLL